MSSRGFLSSAFATPSSTELVVEFRDVTKVKVKRCVGFVADDASPRLLCRAGSFRPLLGCVFFFTALSRCVPDVVEASAFSTTRRLQ
jgi:hypothetical protein